MIFFLPYEQVIQAQTWGKNLDRGFWFFCILMFNITQLWSCGDKVNEEKGCIFVAKTTNDQMEDQALTHAVVLITLQGMVTVEAWGKIKTGVG